RRQAATHGGSKWHAMSHCNRSRDILGLRLGSDWDRHSGRDKSYSDETDSPRKRTLPTPHQANPRCCKTAPTPPVGHILTNPLGCGSSGKMVINKAAGRGPHDKTCGLFLNRPGRREAAGGHALYAGACALWPFTTKQASHLLDGLMSS